MNLPFYIAKRYLVAKKSQNAINIISWISVFSVAIGTFALVVVLSAFNGLEKIVGKKLGLSENKIGFKTSYNVDDYEEQIKNYEIYNNTPHDILAESLIEFGMATEFVGRIDLWCI